MRNISVTFVAIALLAASVLAQANRQAQVDLQAAIRMETVEGDLARAIDQYKAVVSTHSGDRPVVAMALVRMADCHRKLGEAQAQEIYQRVVREYADQAEAVKLARVALGAETVARTSGPVYRRVWEGPKVDTTGSVSPDGRYLSFVDWDTGDLALRDLQAGTDKRLTNKGTRTSLPSNRLSPATDDRWRTRGSTASGGTSCAPSTSASPAIPSRSASSRETTSTGLLRSIGPPTRSRSLSSSTRGTNVPSGAWRLCRPIRGRYG
jgi:hypothetical protein